LKWGGSRGVYKGNVIGKKRLFFGKLKRERGKQKEKSAHRRVARGGLKKPKRVKGGKKTEWASQLHEGQLETRGDLTEGCCAYPNTLKKEKRTKEESQIAAKVEGPPRGKGDKGEHVC